MYKFTMKNSVIIVGLLSTLLLVVSYRHTHCCEFPEYLSSRGADSLRREWHIYSTVTSSGTDVPLSSRSDARPEGGGGWWTRHRSTATVSFMGFMMRLDQSAGSGADHGPHGKTDELMQQLRAPFTRFVSAFCL